MGWKYAGISSRHDYTGTFDQFKQEFEQTHVFQSIKAKDRLVEMKKAFAIATEGLKNKKVVVEK